jgi:hypothetical protein
MKLEVRLLALLVTVLAVLPLVSAGPHPPAGVASGTTADGGVGADAVPDTLLGRALATAGPAAGPAAPVDRALAVSLSAAAVGKSRALRTRIVVAGAIVALNLEWEEPAAGQVRYRWRPVLGTRGDGATGILAAGDLARAPDLPGVYEVEVSDGGAVRDFGEDLRVVVTVPFERKRNGRIGPYHMGTWPTEGKAPRDGYAPPAGFIEVTRENQSLALSRHFTVREFLTKDQESVWPKYVAIDPRLVDKLELVLLELRDMGVRADRMVVMSGFRTPQYNRYRLGNPATSLSRHQFGDAADVWVDNEGDGYMSDLNGDGRRDIEDARLMLRAVERVERRHPDLLGGAGLYRANRARGPFIHIDVRGTPARW